MKFQLSLETIVEVYWRGQWPSFVMLGLGPRPCALCGRDLNDTGTVPPESLHPCPPCGGWHHVHNACVDDGDLVLRSGQLCRSYAQLVVCPEALRVAEELMGESEDGSFASLYYPWAFAGGSDA